MTTPPYPTPTPLATPNFDSSCPLSLTKSHLSVEATTSTLPPLVSPIPLPASSFTPSEPHPRRHSSSNSSTSSTLHSGADSHSGSLGTVTHGDLEKGKGAEDADLEKGLEEVELGARAVSDSETKLKSLDGSDVIVLDWKSADDPAFPKNWSKGRRMGGTLVVASFTFLSPVSSTMIAPAVSQITTRFNITNEVEASMIVSIFVLAYAFGPLVLGPMSEIYGRRIVLQTSNILYFIFNLACGFATNKGQMFAFRFLAGLGGSAPLAIGAGVLGDLWRPEERGKAAALYSLGPLLGPALGPVCGGWISQMVPNDGYRWVFFSTSIACALIQLVGFFYLKETYAPTLLHHQAQALKKTMGLDPQCDRVQTVFDVKAGKKTMSHVVKHGLMRPFAMFYSEHIIQILAAYMSLIYGIIYITTVSTTDIFINIYHESVGIAGTNFLAQGLGFLMWAQVQGRLTDHVFRILKSRNNGVAKPEFRLPLMIPASLFLPAGLLIYGWGAQQHVHWIVPDIGLWFIAAGMIGNFQAINTFLIDAFGQYAASAMAAATFFRSLCGFGFPLFAPYMYQAVGYGWGCSVLALVAAVIGIPAAPVLYKFGERIRARSKYAMKQ